ncbi:ABC transporter ATP-binding protein [Pseudonocardia ailaonensis]|uniref:ABC transporter ATP-binding protein n=1 Tax=Pseudonocardia ailaonensis TaxID=367279 RepID=A0ABN2MZL0_9PSEU
MTTLLTAEAVSVRFGGLQALDEIDLTLAENEFLGLVGPNGAGKTTALDVLSGRRRPSGGTVRFRGDDVTGQRSWQLARRGLVRTFQANMMFESRTVRDHIRLGIQAANGPGAFRTLLRTFGRDVGRGAEVETIAERFHLSGALDENADELPFGSQRLLGIAMSVTACTVFPGVLLLDEPLAGMNDVEMSRALDIFATLRERGFSILMIEHNMAAVSRAADRLYVFDRGRNLAEGPPEVVLADPDVMSAYLGADLDGSELPQWTGGV